MKKHILFSLLIFFSIQLIAQEKGAYLTISGGMGPSGITYKMTDVIFADPKCHLKLGGQAGFGFSYYFTKYLGLSLGVDVAHYRTHGKLIGEFMKGRGDAFYLGSYTDNDYPFGTPETGYIREYDLLVRTRNWVECQSVHLLEIPLIVNLQKKFGKSEGFGLYLGLGAKFQLPIQSKYSILDGNSKEDKRLMVSGYYAEGNLELPYFKPDGEISPDISTHGYGTIHNPSERLTLVNDGKLDLKFNVSLVGEAGIIVSLSRRVDLTLGGFIDYGLLNMRNNNENQALFTGPETDYVSGAERNNVGKGITYGSITQSEYVNRVSSISYGGKVGVRIKLGKLSQKQQQERQRDTVYLGGQEFPIDSLLKAIEDLKQNQPQPLPLPVDFDSILKPYIDALDDAIKKIPAYLPDEHLDYYPNVYPDEEMRFLFEPIYFDLDKSFLKSEAIEILNRKVQILNNYKDIRLIIFGNTCDLGNDPYNFKLGLRRAEAARDYLVNNGIDEGRIQISTLSRFEPERPNVDEFNRTHNRRDDFKPIFPRK
ncbi:MAG: OmpA family protein [Bacteroidales bacterium]|jgi:outer membrane protein OmpA-like peptidoglycan-associated protein|nr:OmpA family protein [Bacteroidales bacterium]